MQIIIVGGGEVVYFLARTFISKGYPVTVINDDRDECEQLARSLNAVVVNGDASDPMVMGDAGASMAQIILAVTPFDYINMVCCQTASLIYNVPRTLALVNDPDNYEIFRHLGISHVFSPTDMIVSLLEKSVGDDNVNHLLTYGNGSVMFSEVIISPKMPSVDREAGAVIVPGDAKILGVTRDGEFFLPDGDFVLRQGDAVLLMTTPESHAPALRVLCGKEA